MPVYPGAPWLPKFEGTEGEEKYREWKGQIKGLLSTQDVNAARKVGILLKTLTGEAKRQVSVLEEGERDTVDKILNYLDGLYKETVPVSKVRAQFYGCIQRPEENVNSYILRLRELFCMLRRGDTAPPSDAALREQFLMGLSEGPLSQALRVHARRNPDQDFTALRNEAVLLDTEHGGTRATEIACHAINPNSTPKSQADGWRKELKREIMEDVNAQMQGFTKALNEQGQQFTKALNEQSQQFTGALKEQSQQMQGVANALNEIRPLLPSAAAAYPRSPPPPAQRYTRRYVPQQNEWDEAGRPICRQCKQSGHIARFCRANQSQQLN